MNIFVKFLSVLFLWLIAFQATQAQESTTYLINQSSKSSTTVTAFSGKIEIGDPSVSGVLRSAGDFHYVHLGNGKYKLSIDPSGRQEAYYSDSVGLHQFVTNKHKQVIGYFTLLNSRRAYTLQVDYDRDGFVDYLEHVDSHEGVITQILTNNPEMLVLFEGIQGGKNLFCGFPKASDNSTANAIGSDAVSRAMINGCTRNGGFAVPAPNYAEGGVSGSSYLDLLCEDFQQPSGGSYYGQEMVTDRLGKFLGGVAKIAGAAFVGLGTAAASVAAVPAAPILIFAGGVATVLGAFSGGYDVTEAIIGREDPIPGEQVDGVEVFCEDFLNNSDDHSNATWIRRAGEALRRARCLDPTVNPGLGQSGSEWRDQLNNPVDDRFCSDNNEDDGIPNVSDVLQAGVGNQCPPNAEPDGDGNCLSSGNTPPRGSVQVDLGAVLLEMVYDNLGIVDPIDPPETYIPIDRR